MGSKTLKAIKKRFKITKKGKILRRKASQAHGQVKDTVKTLNRRSGYVPLKKSLAKKVLEKYI